VADAELSAGDGVEDAAVAGAVIGEDALDGYAVAAVEGGGAAEEAGSGAGFLVVEHLGVGEAAVVVDGDVDVLPAFDLAELSDPAGLRLARPGAADPVTDPADTPELLDVDVEQLSRS
jgi:hypothetical protein